MSHLILTRTEIESRILGCLYGQAIGNAMGMPSELWPKKRIQQFFGWIDDFLPGPLENLTANAFKAGEFTDDTHQCLAVMDAIIEKNGTVEPFAIASHIVQWALSVNAFEKNILEPTTKASLLAIHQGTAIELINSNGVTNGSAMRISPIGCLTPSFDKEKFIKQVRFACLPTHKSDVAIAGAAVIAWSITRAIEGVNWDQIKQEIIPLANEIQRRFSSTFNPLLGKRIAYALSVIEKQPNLTLGLNDLYESAGAGMDIIESVPSAIALVELASTRPMLCAELAANLGGDTDTIGAMATAICGALHGIEAFDQQDIKLINRANQINFAPYAKALCVYRLQQ